MTQTTVPLAGASRALSLPERLIGAIFSPRPTFESVSTHPVWMDVLAVTLLLTAVAWFAFLSTPTGQQAYVDQQLQTMEAWGQTITPEAQQALKAQAPFMRWVNAGATVVIGPLIVVVIASVLYGVFAAILGGGATYKQTLAVVVHAGVVSTLGFLGTMALNFSRETMSSATNLGVFVQMLPEDSFLVRFLGMIDLVWVWYLIVLAIGLGVLYRRKTSTIAMGFFAVYLVVALGIAGVRSALGGS
jgi:hypothetical protein